MKLSARIEPIRLALRTPIITGHGAITHREALLVELEHDERCGWGEASPLPGWSSHPLEETERALREVLGPLQDSSDLATAIASLHGHPHARAALTGAWADLRARQEGRSLAASLSTSHRSELAANAVVTAQTIEEVERESASHRSAGFTTLKLKVGFAHPGTDVERVRAARRAAPDSALRLDANQAWDRSTAVEVLRRVVDQTIEWCEEPTGVLDEFGAVESTSGVRVAADESIGSETDLRHALALGLSVVVVKPQAIGGPDRAAGAARLIEESGATMVVTTFMDSAVGVTHAVHVAAAFGGQVAHGLATSDLLREDVGPAPDVLDGVLHVPEAPGIGFTPSLT